MRGPRKFCKRGPTLTIFFRGEEGPSTTISGPSTARKRFRWRADDGPALNAGLVAL